MFKIKVVKQINGSYCGPANAQMVLAFYGIQKSQKVLARLCKTTMAEGTDNRNLADCLKHFGLKVEHGQGGNWVILNKFINKEKIPVIVHWFYEDWGHKSVVLGLNKKFIWLAESYEGKILKMPWPRFNQIWFGFDQKFPKEKNVIPNYYIAASLAK